MSSLLILSRSFRRFSSQLVSSPLSLYERHLKSGLLKPDPRQAVVANALDRLHQSLQQSLSIPDKQTMWDVNSFSEGESDDDEVKIGMLKRSKEWMKKWFVGTSTEEMEAPEYALRGLYIHGSVGTGKTLLMDFFVRSLPSSIPIYRIHFHAFMLDMHARVHRIRQFHISTRLQDSTSRTDAIALVAAELAQQTRVLCLDEFQVTDIADAMLLRGLLKELLLEHRLVLVTTSNRPPQDLYLNGLQRTSFLPCIALLQRACQVISLDLDIDFRQLKGALPSTQSLARLPAYQSPINAASQTWLNQLLSKWTGAIPVKENVPLSTGFGRTVTVPWSCNGVAQFTFMQICGQALSANDYLTLTKNYKIIVVTHLPRMTIQWRNEARRLITLVDTLYDHRVKLVCTAEVPLDELFSGQALMQHEQNRELGDDLDLNEKDLLLNPLFSGAEETFAFGRAYSRLVEMQGPEWLGQDWPSV